MSLKIIFAGTPAFSDQVLKTLLTTEHTIIAVLTQMDRPKGRGQKLTQSPVKETALAYQAYPIPVYQPLSLKDPEQQQLLKELQPDVMVVVSYGLILPPQVLSIPKYGCINVHVSLLPKWRGAAPIQRAILAGDTETGVTIMQMDKGLDTGDILTIQRCPIANTDTSETLHHKLADLGAKTLIETLEKLEKNELSPIKQDNANATIAPKITKEEALIDWSKSAREIDCQIRAFNPWPVAFTRLKEETIRIFKAVPQVPEESKKNMSAEPPGTIIAVDKNSIHVATHNGILSLLEIQLSGGKRLPVRDILNSKASLFQKGFRFS